MQVLTTVWWVHPFEGKGVVRGFFAFSSLPASLGWYDCVSQGVGKEAAVSFDTRRDLHRRSSGPTSVREINVVSIIFFEQAATPVRATRFHVCGRGTCSKYPG